MRTAIALALLAACTTTHDRTIDPVRDPGDKPGSTGGSGSGSPASGYLRTDLVADQDGVARRTDLDVVNAWGIATGEGGFWIANNANGKLAIFDGDGKASTGEYVSGAVTLEAGITGAVANTTDGFVISCSASMPADFLFASQSGKIFGVNVALNGREGIVAHDSSDEHAQYTGLAIVKVGNVHRLVLADLANARIAVYTDRFEDVDTTGLFVDPNLPADYAPFNVAAIRDQVYVAYVQKTDEGDEAHGPGLGLIDVFTTDGYFIGRLATGGMLNAPWAMAMAPASFGSAGGTLLVGNFGDGRITEFDARTGVTIDQLADPNRIPIAVDGLWGFSFGDGRDAGSSNVLYFAAGPGEEMHGLFGRIEVAQ